MEFDNESSTSGGSPTTKHRSLATTRENDHSNDHSAIHELCKSLLLIRITESKNGVFDCRRKPEELSPSPEDLRARMSEVILSEQSTSHQSLY